MASGQLYHFCSAEARCRIRLRFRFLRFCGGSFRISVGAVSAVEARVSAAVQPAVDVVWDRVREADVKHTDGTSWFQSGVSRALWTIATAAATVFKIVADGSKKTLEPLYGALQGILVSDRAKALNFWAMERRQICWGPGSGRYRAGDAGRRSERRTALSRLQQPQHVGHSNCHSNDATPGAEAARARPDRDARGTARTLSAADNRAPVGPRSGEARLAQLSLAQLQLAQGKAAAALAGFDAYQRSGGALAQEAHYGKIQALRALRRTADERVEIQRFSQHTRTAYRSPL